MEELLRKLIEKGWKPFGDEKIHSFEIIYVTWKVRNIVAKRWRWQVNKHYSIRELVSKESWLWQFVCENKLENSKERKQWTDLDEDGREYVKYSTKIYEYWFIESALCDEDKLEEFLLKSIKVDD